MLLKPAVEAHEAFFWKFRIIPYKSFRSQMNLFLIAPCASGDFKIASLNKKFLLISNCSVTFRLSVIFKKKKVNVEGTCTGK